MRTAILAFVFAMAASSAAQAACTGTRAFSTCYDDSGNSYTVMRYGSTTQMDGYNSRTGTSWSQTSFTYGSFTDHTGYTSNGGHWQMTQQRIGNISYYTGTNAQGEYFSYSCDQYGCD